ncbi:MAG: hypothetical protein HP492_02050 [Nitrospira sp.]|nr:hypothetical protein [Nitrospira sp.]
MRILPSTLPAPSHLLTALAIVFVYGPAASAQQFGTPKGDEGTRIFKATEHPHYSGQFHLSGQKAILIGSMKDEVPWDHLDYAGKRLTAVQGTIDIEVNELTNNGQVVAEFVEGGDRYRLLELTLQIGSQIVLQPSILTSGS